MSARLASVVVVSLLACACSSPTTPTPLPVQNPVPTPAPPPVVLPLLVFTPDTTTPIANSFTLFGDTSTAGEVMLTMNANAFQSLRHISSVRATLLYDPLVLVPDNSYEAGSWLTQGSLLTTFLFLTAPGEVIVRIDRPDSLAGVSGSGPVFAKRFRVVAGVRNRTTQVEWNDIHAYATTSLSDLLGRAYGGTIRIQ